jgi:hypothetical protein
MHRRQAGATHCIRTIDSPRPSPPGASRGVRTLSSGDCDGHGRRRLADGRAPNSRRRSAACAKDTQHGSTSSPPACEVRRGDRTRPTGARLVKGSSGELEPDQVRNPSPRSPTTVPKHRTRQVTKTLHLIHGQSRQTHRSGPMPVGVRLTNHTARCATLDPPGRHWRTVNRHHRLRSARLHVKRCCASHGAREVWRGARRRFGALDVPPSGRRSSFERNPRPKPGFMPAIRWNSQAT